VEGTTCKAPDRSRERPVILIYMHEWPPL
jgi:hypothetical protein